MPWIPNHKQSMCLWDQGHQRSQGEKVKGHSQDGSPPKCTCIWQLSTPAKRRGLPMLPLGSEARQYKGNYQVFATALLTNNLEQLMEINKQVLITVSQTIGYKNHKFVTCLKSYWLHWTSTVGERQSQTDAGTVKESRSHISSRVNNYNFLPDNHPSGEAKCLSPFRLL